MSEPARTTVMTSAQKMGTNTGSRGFVSIFPTTLMVVLRMSSNAAAIFNPALLQASAASTQAKAMTSMTGAAGLTEVSTPYVVVSTLSGKITSEKALVRRA